MKNARLYEKKVKKLLTGLPKAHPGSDDADPLWIMVRTVFEADASLKLADKAMALIREEFVDLNELRVAQPKEIHECVGRDYPRGRQKAEMVTTALYGIYRRTCGITTDYMRDMSKRDLRRHLHELGLDHYAAAAMTLMVFEGHAIPVDRDLTECLQIEGMIHPESDPADTQGFLERIIPQKNALAAHQFFRGYVQGLAKALSRKRKADAAKAEAERLAAEAAEKARAEEAEKQEKAAARKAAKKKKKKAKKSSSSRKSAKRSAKKTSARKKAAGKKRVAKKKK